MYLVLGIPDPVALRTVEYLAARGDSVCALGGLESRALLPSGVEHVVGDPASIDFGLAGSDYSALLSRVDELILADTSYVSSGDVEQGRLVRQAAEVAEFVKAGGAPSGVRLLSSLLVFGSAEGAAAEDDFEVGQSFRDGYEESLAVAEKIVRSLRLRRPLAIVRTAPISGDERTGELNPEAPLAHLARKVQSGAEDRGYIFTDLPIYFETVDRAAQALLRVTPKVFPSVVHLVDLKPLTDRTLILWLSRAASKSVHELPASARPWSSWTRATYPGDRSLSGFRLRFLRKRAEQLLGDLLDRDQLAVLESLFASREGRNGQ
jgi:hypothetical protein